MAEQHLEMPTVIIIRNIHTFIPGMLGSGYGHKYHQGDAL
jgi:hypothetical protein